MYKNKKTWILCYIATSYKFIYIYSNKVPGIALDKMSFFFVLSFFFCQSKSIGIFSYFYQVSSKYCVGYSGYNGTENQIQTQDGEITPKGRRPELSFLYATCYLVLFYILPSIIKIFQRVSVLQSGHEIKLKHKWR